MKTFELTPINGRKSFYGKCTVNETENFLILKSYDTEVAGYDKENKKIDFSVNKETLSNTTLIHINAFLDYLSMPKMDKKQVLSKSLIN